MSITPWSDIGDTLTTDIGDKIGVFKTAGLTIEDQFKLLPLSQIRSTPQNTHYVRNQDELELALGTDLIIPANTAVTIVVDESMFLGKPFKKQPGSSLLIYSESSSVFIFYFGVGALIQMDGDPTIIIGARTQCRNITLVGDGNECFALNDLEFVILDFCVLLGFAKLGFLRNTSIAWNGTIGFGNFGGLDLIDCRALSLSNSGGDDLGVLVPHTLFSIINPNTVITIIFQTSSYFNPSVQSELLFLDPNAPTGSFFTIKDAGITTVDPESLFQKGVDETITAVANNGSGKIRCTVSGHTQINGTYAVLSGFTEPYNKTAKITFIDVNTFDVEDIDFTINDTGNINRSSLDSTAPKVSATSNPNQRDSMFIASVGFENYTSPIQIAIVTDSIPQVIPSTEWVFDNLERFEPDPAEPAEGKIVAKDVSLREYSVRYSGSLEKQGGAAGDIGLVLLKNGVEVSFNPPHSVNTGIIQISGDDLIELTEGDTLQVGVINYDGTEQVNISQLSLVVSKG